MTANGDRTRGRSPGIWLRLEACSVRKPMAQRHSGPVRQHRPCLGSQAQSLSRNALTLGDRREVA
jgi:hypothetical protein